VLWACLHFPYLPLDTLARADPGRAALAIATGDTRPRIVAANGPARVQGVHAGMSVAAALALTPELIVRPRNPRLEAQTLQEIAQWALQFSPMLSLSAADAVLLEIGAGLKLFAGLAAVLATIRTGLTALGITATVAAAPTPTAALMLARANKTQALTAAALLERQLSPLPIDTMVYSESILETLADLGVHSVGDLMQLPRDGLARRFGPALIDTLDRALGRLPDPQAPFIAPERFSSRLELPAPAWEAQALLFGAKRLHAALAGWLLGKGLGVMRLRFELIHEDCVPSVLTLKLSAPSRDPEHLGILLRERLARTQLPDRVEAIVLTAEETACLAAHNRSLFPGSEPAADTELCERLAARLGDDAVCALRPHADHRPEFAWRTGPYPTKDCALKPPAPRPLWLLSEPRALDTFLHEGHAQLVLMDGPERIESGWWEGGEVRRDYFVARARSGQMLWVFKRSGSGKEWYVHGIFS
jgi:protein ImuB